MRDAIFLVSWPFGPCVLCKCKVGVISMWLQFKAETFDLQYWLFVELAKS